MGFITSDMPSSNGSPNTTELKSCPFCGTKAMLFGGGTRLGAKAPYRIECASRLCGAVLNAGYDKPEAVKMWNTRISSC
jgi:Lar family restriction alleviation protein